ncbi:MAG: hypothetical protein M3S32_07300 [Acidobacteriota bacterium]|nr:hypothetical protein [Acidobacteriota bacterium]
MIGWRRAAAAPALAALLLAAPLPAAPDTPAKKRTPRPARPGAHGSQTDFTGIWELDSKSSSLGSQRMENAVLQVTQSGDRLWIQPLGNTRARVLAEEVVVDGRAYEKALGKERGTLTAKWGNDAKSLWLEVVAGTDENPRAAVQRSVWRLSDDRQVWVRETMTVQKDGGHRTRLVFRRQDPKKVTPAATPPPA